MPDASALRPLILLAAAATAPVAVAPASAAARGTCRGATTPVSHLSTVRIRTITLCALDAERRRAGLAPLHARTILTRPAQRHTRVMVTRGQLGHGDLGRRLRAYTAGHRFAIGENVASDPGARVTVATIVRRWMRSPPHRANILQPRFRDVGIGVVRRCTAGGRGATFTASFGWRG